MSESIPQKQCCRCRQHKPATKEFFHAGKNYKDGWDPRCKDCVNSTKKHQVEDGYKCCTKCHQKLPATHEYFTKSKSEKYGLCAVCRVCRRKHAAESQILGIFPPDGCLKQCTQCGQLKPANKSYFMSDRSKSDHLTTQCKSCIKRKRQAIPRTVEYYEKRRRQWLHYYHGHIEYARMQANIGSRIRRNRKQGVGGSYTQRDIREQYKRQRGKCYYCYAHIQKYHIEHIVPLSRGGSNDVSNIVLACPTCNWRKGNKLPHEWLEGGRLL